MLYCLKCKKKTADKNVTSKIAKNGRKMIVAKCAVCGTMKHQFTANQKGGNPAIIGAVVQAVPGAIKGIGDAVDQGRRTTHDFEKDEGKVTYKKAGLFEQYYRDLMHKRYWDGESLPPSLRWPREKTNNPKYATQQEAKDEALWNYAEKQWDKMNR